MADRMSELDRARFEKFPLRLEPEMSNEVALDWLCSEVQQLFHLSAACVYVRDARPHVAPQGLTGFTELDRLQYVERGGPGVDTLDSGESVVAADLRDASTGWRVYARTLLMVGIHSVASIPLGGRTRCFGVLTLYSLPVRQWSIEELRLLHLMSALVSNHRILSAQVSRETAALERISVLASQRRVPTQKTAKPTSLQGLRPF